jgi:hypothetical protein
MMLLLLLLTQEATDAQTTAMTEVHGSHCHVECVAHPK